MPVLAIVLICLTCASYGGRLQTPTGKDSDADTPNPSEAFASLLEVLKPAAAYNLPPASAARSRTASTAIDIRARSPNMQYNGGSSWNSRPAWRTPATTAAVLERSEVHEAVKAVETTDALAPEKAAAEKAPAPKKETDRLPTPTGPFAPAVLAAKRVMGEKELVELRAEIIRQHTKVISSFIDTSESKFGQLVLKKMFEAADADNNGTLDKEEIRDALYALGFTFMKDKEVDRLVKKADVDKNEVIDFEEFVKETPKMLRVNLVKLAKSNGHDLGFLA